jgi:hypothetical protein
MPGSAISAKNPRPLVIPSVSASSARKQIDRIGRHAERLLAQVEEIQEHQHCLRPLGEGKWLHRRTAQESQHFHDPYGRDERER